MIGGLGFRADRAELANHDKHCCRNLSLLFGEVTGASFKILPLFPTKHLDLPSTLYKP